jgi:membrane protease YdiL (CAAX protease family)
MMDEQNLDRNFFAGQSTELPRFTFIERNNISPILFGLLALALLFILYQVVGGLVTLFLFGAMPTSENVTGYRITTGLGQIIFLLIPTLLLVRLVTFTPKQYLRIRMPDVRTLILPLIGIFSLQQLLQLYVTLQDMVPLPEPIQRMVQEMKDMLEAAYKVLVDSNSLSELLFVFFIVAMIPAVVEELLFRGLILRSFEKKMGSTKSIFLTGIIFAAYHLNPFLFIPLAAIGIYLGFLTVRANSVWVSSVAHFFNNALACVAVYFHLDDDAIVTGTPNAMSAGLLIATFIFFATVFAISTYYFVQITKHNQEVHSAEVSPDGSLQNPNDNVVV